MTSALPPSITAATTELVVPRSMPTAFAIGILPLGLDLRTRSPDGTRKPGPQGLRGSPGGLRSLTMSKGRRMTATLDIAPCSPADRDVLFELAEVAFAN